MWVQMLLQNPLEQVTPQDLHCLSVLTSRPAGFWGLKSGGVRQGGGQENTEGPVLGEGRPEGERGAPASFPWPWLGSRATAGTVRSVSQTVFSPSLKFVERSPCASHFLAVSVCVCPLLCSVTNFRGVLEERGGEYAGSVLPVEPENPVLLYRVAHPISQQSTQ